MKVFVLIALVAKTPFVGPTQVDGTALVFKEAASCLKDIPRVKAILEKEYDNVLVECSEKEIR